MEKILPTNYFWELCIYADADFEPYFQKARVQIKQCYPTSILAHNEVNDTFLFAVEPVFVDSFTKIISSQICHYLIKKEKIRFFSKGINNLTLLGELEPIFLKLLEQFDYELDILEIEKKLRLNKQLRLNEFFIFMCNNLKKKWQVVCDMTNENNFFFSSKELTFQLLRFLLSNCKRKVEELVISKDMSFIYITNKEQKIAQFDINEDKKNSGNKIVLEILKNLPNRLVMKDKKMFDKNFVGLLDLIFKNSLKQLINA